MYGEEIQVLPNINIVFVSMQCYCNCWIYIITVYGCCYISISSIIEPSRIRITLFWNKHSACINIKLILINLQETNTMESNAITYRLPIYTLL